MWQDAEIQLIREAEKLGHSNATVLNLLFGIALCDWRGLDDLRDQLGLKPICGIQTIEGTEYLVTPDGHFIKK